MRQLLIIGAGGFGRETAEIVHAINAQQPTWTLLGFLDDADLTVASIEGVPVLGAISLVERYPDASVVVTTGNPRNYFSRRLIVERIGLSGARYATLVHPTAVLPRSVSLGVGSVLGANVVATAALRVGDHTAILPGVVMSHDAVIGNYVTVGAGVRLAGGVRLRDGAYLGAGALIREGCTIGQSSLVGMGAAVLTDVPDWEVWVGAPARRLRAVTRNE